MSLAQWVERAITVDGQPEPVRLGVWLSGTKSRRDRLNTDQLTALAKLGMDWAKAVTIPQAAPDSA
ncbi:hypothetical protein ACFV2I_35420 [Streptomyces microflavus]|uniref:hypothetical protein n=1 Tax=Streptomyces microflavus TaxID=1919 RepID=UPI00368991DA